MRPPGPRRSGWSAQAARASASGPGRGGEGGDREIGVGARVRSLDFQWPLRFENSYVEGVVLAVLDPEDPAQAFPAYEIRVERRVLGGVEQSDFPDTIYAPVNGLEMPGGARTSGVTLLGPPA